MASVEDTEDEKTVQENGRDYPKLLVAPAPHSATTTATPIFAAENDEVTDKVTAEVTSKTLGIFPPSHPFLLGAFHVAAMTRLSISSRERPCFWFRASLLTRSG